MLDGGWWEEWLKISQTVVPGYHDLGMEIFHRKSKWVKLDRTIIVGVKR
jgi:hypothetical protein